MSNTVNHPSQHNWGGMDWIDVVKDVGGFDDLQEARWYLDLLLDFKRYD